jgi:TPP-dependent pyruvate/acetoin dehydrogenase alpha subunit
MRFADRYDELFFKALRVRRVEEKIIDLYPSDRIQSPVHLSIGQEAVAVGACHPLRDSDLLFATYRSHAFYLAKGGDLARLFAELYGKATGCCKGKGGSMHLAAPEVGLMGTSAIVASTTPHAVGAALAAKVRNSGQVVVAVFGDGATDQGVHHESLNFAALHNVPVLFLCENNGWAVHSPRTARQAYEPTAQAALYGIPVERIERGWDMTAIADTVGAIVADIRKTGGPRFLEVVTCRYFEHVGIGDDSGHAYRRQERLDEWKARDPLVHDAERRRRFTATIDREIGDAVRFAEASPWPAADELMTDVY